MNTTPLENMRTLAGGGAPAWIPFSLDVGAMPGFTEPIAHTFRQITGSDDSGDYFDTDIRLFSLKSHFAGSDPASLHEAVESGTTFDEWGIGHWAGGSEGTVEKSYPVLAHAESVGDVEALPTPVIETDVDTSAVQRYHDAGYPVFGYGGSIYEWSWWLRGMEQFMMDLVADTALAEAILRKVADHTTRLAVASARAGIDVLSFYDDVGMQSGMQISPGLWRRYVKPEWQKVLDAVRQVAPDVKFFLHSCGKIDTIIPDVIELGFHILHPVQPECMDFETVYRRYGQQIVLTACISAQKIFPFGSPDDVRQEVRRLVDVTGAERRTILMPSNIIQPETPWENVVAFAQEARDCSIRC